MMRAIGAAVGIFNSRCLEKAFYASSKKIFIILLYCYHICRIMQHACGDFQQIRPIRQLRLKMRKRAIPGRKSTVIGGNRKKPVLRLSVRFQFSPQGVHSDSQKPRSMGFVLIQVSIDLQKVIFLHFGQRYGHIHLRFVRAAHDGFRFS